jgi:hypothetical protein
MAARPMRRKATAARREAHDESTTGRFLLRSPNPYGAGDGAVHGRLLLLISCSGNINKVVARVDNC